MSLFYGFEVKDIRIKDVPTDDKDAVNKKYVDREIKNIKHKLYGSARFGLRGNVFQNQTINHIGWPIGQLVMRGNINIIINGLMIDNDVNLPPNYDFKLRIIVFDTDSNRYEYDTDLYKSLTSSVVPLSLSTSEILGRCFYRDDKSEPSINISSSADIVFIFFQIKEASGLDGPECFINYSIEY